MKLFRPTWGRIAVAACLACGGRAEDTTIIEVPPSPSSSPAMDAMPSAALQALAQPAARDAFCGWVGASAASVAGTGLDCSQLVERCRAAAANMGTTGPVAVPGLLGAADLSGLLGCPVSFDQVDACVAELVDWVVARYPDGPGCGMATPIQPPGLQDLSMLTSCVVVAADCPALLQQLLAARGLGG